jgi:probable rRNA maturation factor
MMPTLKPLGEAPQVDVQIQSALWDAEPDAAETVRTAIAAAAATIPVQGLGLSVSLTDDETIRSLNRQWRDIDKATNVLSFPAAHTPAAIATKFFGDIIIGYETLKQECADENMIFLHHLAHLTVHGFLHLMGYNHESDPEANDMEGVESKIMVTMGLPDPWRGREFNREFGGA